ncbi:response regulator transcription factor [Desertibacillus haloalkaliphilus]|uniref:response regulator transcription factor n=1 Tax=Desertibacillus haloalkaliphilus TaxID=1328930 RepID=UPI0028AD00CF|nr:response regulator transcription factor [Desertibacillus haloalkaliphilus]
MEPANVEATFHDSQPQAFVIYHDDASENICETIKKIHNAYAHAKVLLLSTALEQSELRTFISHGLTAVLYLDGFKQTVHQAIDVIEHGYYYFDNKVITFILNDYQNMLKGDQSEAAPLVRERFSGREMEVLQLLANGWSNQAIANALYLSKYTVYNHVRNIIMKMGVQDRTTAAVYAIKHQLVSLSDSTIKDPTSPKKMAVK